MNEDYKNLPRDRMAKQYDRKKDKNYDEFHKQNPMGIGPRVSRGKRTLKLTNMAIVKKLRQLVDN